VPESYDRILIFNSAFPGDIILTTPLIRAVSDRFPEASLAFCTTPAGARLLAGLSYLDQLVIYDKHGRDRGFFGVLKTARRIQKEGFDLVFSAHRSLRTAILLRLAGIPIRAGFYESAGSSLYNVKVHRLTDLHETERNLSLLQPFGASLDRLSKKPVLPVTGEESNQVFGRLGALLPQGQGPFVVIAPGSVWATKMWLAERFAEIIDLLAREYSARVLMVGSPLDRPQADRVIAACKSPVLDLVGKTELRELCALVRRADLVITGDSAPMHIAWAFDIPTVAIFGATTPELGFAPCSPSCRVVEVQGLECRPCSAHGPNTCRLGHFRCMRDITVEMVRNACLEMLASRIRHDGPG
jgi:heptosyltransferase-2